MQPNAPTAAQKKAQQDLRAMYAELCYWYPQYKIEDLTSDEDGLAIGDINLLLTFARMQYYQDKLDTLFVTTGAQSKKGFRQVKEKLQRNIKAMKARI